MDKATVDFIADAKVGDVVWVCEGNRNVYDKNNKYLGRGLWSLKTVTKLSRKYFTVNGRQEFTIGEGFARCVNGFTPQDRAMGHLEYWRKTNERNVLDVVSSLNTKDMMLVSEFIVRLTNQHKEGV